MSNKTILQNCNNRLNTNNFDLDTILSKLNDLADAGGIVEDLSDELTQQDNLIDDQETTIEDVILVLQNKASGGEANLQEKIIAPTLSVQNVIADVGFTGLSKVTVSAVTSAIDSDIKATNIRSGINILGVNGTLKEGIVPTGTFSVIENGSYDITNYANVNVNVASVSDTTIEDGLISRTLTGEYVNNRITTIGGNALRMMPFSSLHCENVTSVAGEAIRQCNNLVSVYLPKCVTLGSYSLGICSKLETVELNNVTSIGAYSFYQCTKLTSLIIRTTSQVCSLSNVNAFTSSGIENGTGYVYVPDNLVANYKSATNWSTYAARIKSLNELGK